MSSGVFGAYLVAGPFGIRMTAEIEQVTGNIVAYRTAPITDFVGLTIWMDGRPHTRLKMARIPCPASRPACGKEMF